MHESIIGILFYGRLIEETKVGPYPAVVPTVTGSAYIRKHNNEFRMERIRNSI